MVSQKEICLKVVILSIVIIIGFAFIISGLTVESSFPEKQLTYGKTLPENIGNVVVLMQPKEAFVIGNDLYTLVAVTLSKEYISNNLLIIDIYFPDAIVQYDTGNSAQSWQDFHFWLNTTEIHDTYTTYSRIVILKYMNEGAYGMNVSIYGSKTDNFSLPLVFLIHPLSYIDDKNRSDALYALNIELFGFAVIASAPTFVILINAIGKLRKKKPPCEDYGYDTW